MSDILTEKEFWEQQNKLKKQLHKPRKTITEKRTSTELLGVLVNNTRKIQELTMNGELIIDRVCLLSYPLNDPRTRPEIRALYLEQEELMMNPIMEEEPPLSSPAAIHRREDLSIVSRLKTMTDEQVEAFKTANWKYLHKIYPENNKEEESGINGSGYHGGEAQGTCIDRRIVEENNINK